MKHFRIVLCDSKLAVEKLIEQHIKHIVYKINDTYWASDRCCHLNVSCDDDTMTSDTLEQSLARCKYAIERVWVQSVCCPTK